MAAKREGGIQQGAPKKGGKMGVGTNSGFFGTEITREVPWNVGKMGICCNFAGFATRIPQEVPQNEQKKWDFGAVSLLSKLKFTRERQKMVGKCEVCTNSGFFWCQNPSGGASNFEKNGNLH